MGYESKIFVIERNVISNHNVVSWVYGSEIARFRLGKVLDSGFTKLFETPIDFTLSGDMGEDDNIDLTFDAYGERCKYAEINEVIEWLREQIKHDDYRRWKPLLAMLEAFEPNKWTTCSNDKSASRLVIVHYGY